jgi:hypothetical protein
MYAAWLCSRITSIMLQLSYNFNAAYFNILQVVNCLFWKRSVGYILKLFKYI